MGPTLVDAEQLVRDKQVIQFSILLVGGFNENRPACKLLVNKPKKSLS